MLCFCRCRVAISAVVLCFLATIVACASKPEDSTPKSDQRAGPTNSAPALLSADADAAQQRTSLVLPTNFGLATGDWDKILKRGHLRALVVYNRGGFYYDKGRPRGMVIDAMDEFEKKINKRLRTGAKKFTVQYLSVPPGQLLQDLNEGLGDIVCTGVIVTPEREKLADFTIPVASGIKLVVVSHKGLPPINDLADLSGRDIFVNPIAVAKEALDNLNQQFSRMGKPQVVIRTVDPNLTESDLLEMVNAGLVPATVAMSFRAQMWAQAYTDLVISPVTVRDEGDLAWAMRKNSPQLKAEMDDFVKTHRIGTTFGNMMIQRYVKNPKVLKDSTSEAEMAKFKQLVKY